MLLDLPCTEPLCGEIPAELRLPTAFAHEVAGINGEACGDGLTPWQHAGASGESHESNLNDSKLHEVPIEHRSDEVPAKRHAVANTLLAPNGSSLGGFCLFSVHLMIVESTPSR